MNFIIYSDDTTSNSYGITKINELIYKKLMHNEIHKLNRFSIAKEKIEKEFNINVQSDNNELNVILMRELSKSQLENYLEIYDDENDNIEKYVELLSIILYNQINPEKYKIKKKLDILLSSISEYWENPLNCNITLTDKFIKRRFNNSNYIGNNKLLSNAIFNNRQFGLNNSNDNYLNDIIRDNNWKDMCIKKYYLSKKSTMTNDDIIMIYKQLPTEYLKYMFLSNMLCSRINCHLILNNKKLLELSKPIFDKYKIIFKYIIGYAWITLKNEEYYKFTTDDDRIIFDIDTANNLPLFPFTWDDINQNPYAVILIDKEILNIKQNCLSMNMMREYEKYYGVCNSQEFSRRLNIFVNSENKKGILDFIDWSCCVITGSVMTACGMKYNPLIDICKTTNSSDLSDNDLSSYFFHYYNDSDVDLICNKESIIDFIDVVYEFINKLSKEKITIKNVHTGAIIISDEFITNELENMKKVLNSDKIDLEYVNSNILSQDIKNYFYDKYYINWKLEHEKEIKKIGKFDIQLFKEYIKPISREEFRIYKLDYDLSCDNLNINNNEEKYFYSKDKNIIIAKMSESIRFKVSIIGYKTFEIFKSKNKNFFSVISKFHMGFVRAYWNGTTVKCLPSYITSMMLQLAVDYKYFASIRDPGDIINKYRSRGFGIILNDFEKLHLAHFNSIKLKDSDSNTKWIEMYKVNIKNKQSVENIFGVKKSSDDIFKPSKFFIGLPSDCYKNINHDTVSTFDECFNSIISPKLITLSKYKAISDSGKINPLMKDVVNLGWSLMNNK